MPDTGRGEGLSSTVADWLVRFPGEVTCALQVWYESLGGMGTPDPFEIAAIEKVLESAEGWGPAGNVRYEKMGLQRSFRRRVPGNGGAPGHVMVQHLFKLNSLQRAPDGRLLRVVVSEVYNLRCFEVIEGNMVGRMVKIHPTSDLARSLVEV